MSFHKDLSPEIFYRTSRSSGKGGQHANKTETRVEAVLNIPRSGILSRNEKARIFNRLKRALNRNGDLIVSSDEHRQQSMNKKEATHRLHQRIGKALTPEKPRKTTKKPSWAKEKRLRNKKSRGEQKRLRKPPDPSKET